MARKKKDPVENNTTYTKVILDDGKGVRRLVKATEVEPGYVFEKMHHKDIAIFVKKD